MTIDKYLLVAADLNRPIIMGTWNKTIHNLINLMAIKQYIKDNGTSLSVDQIFFFKSTMALVTVSRLVDGHIKDILYISIYIYII